MQGRTFKTEISVYLERESVVVGIRESCRELETNTEDASGFRPAFVRELFKDPQFIIGEQGIDTEYCFSEKPVIVNGKSREKCEKLYNELIVSKDRQMPVLFIPGDYYHEHTEEVNRKTESMLGFCHVVVLENTYRKLFEQIMNNEEFVEVVEDGQLIYYRTTIKQEYSADYYSGDVEDIMLQINDVAHREPIRKRMDFSKFPFEPSVEDLMTRNDDDERVLAEEKRRVSELKELRQELGDVKRDNDRLQKQNDKLERDNRQYEKDLGKIYSDMDRYEIDIKDREKQIRNLTEEIQRLEAKDIQKDKIINGYAREEKERVTPLLHLPSQKGEVISWIREWYSENIIVHTRAEKSFNSDNRNIDLHKFCMMIHYLAGYTRYRNDGGQTINPHAAREYDPEESSIVVDPVSSGQGAIEMHKDSYTISIPTVDGGKENVILDLHLKAGKGGDANMIRIYFYYSPELKKSIIGYMPGHLETRKAAH